MLVFDHRTRNARHCYRMDVLPSVAVSLTSRIHQLFRREIAGELAPSLVSGYELIGHVVEVVADNLRLRADP